MKFIKFGILLIVNFVFNLNNLKAQPLILGTSSEGGAAFGTIFHTDIDHQDFKTFQRKS